MNYHFMELGIVTNARDYLIKEKGKLLLGGHHRITLEENVLDVDSTKLYQVKGSLKRKNEGNAERQLMWIREAVSFSHDNAVKVAKVISSNSRYVKLDGLV